MGVMKEIPVLMTDKDFDLEYNTLKIKMEDGLPARLLQYIHRNSWVRYMHLQIKNARSEKGVSQNAQNQKITNFILTQEDL